MIDGFCVCRQGKVRTANQDRAGCFFDGDRCLAFVADGMGGHFGGEMASETVAQACLEWWESYAGASQRPAFLQSVEQLRGVLFQCHEKIARIAPPQAICGTTAVLLWVAGEEYALFSVGDSRCYAAAKWFGVPLKPVQLTHDDVSTEPGLAGKLTRALGPGTCSFSLKTGRVRRKMVFALCSDGVYKMCPKLLTELRSASLGRKLGKAADRITVLVDANGAPDNYSLVLLRV